MELTEAYKDLRPLLFSIAYRMLGSVAEAEDLVQEAFLRYHGALESTEIKSPKAYLTTTTTRLAIDQLRSDRVRREQYVGEWLPEPLLTDEAALEGARYVEEADSLSMAFILVLERLNPVERAVFLLHDVFDYGYAEITRVVGKSEANCRQLAARARRRVHEEKPRFEPSREQHEQLARRFFEAVGGSGDVDDLAEMLAADVVAYGDGGGKVPAIRRPVHGREPVAHLLSSLAKLARQLDVRMRRAEINGRPGAMYLDRDGRLMSVVTIDVAGGRVQAVRSVSNPDKLRHLGPPADIQALLRGRTERVE